MSLLVMIDNKDFDVLKDNSKDYYTLIEIGPQCVRVFNAFSAKWIV